MKVWFNNASSRLRGMCGRGWLARFIGGGFDDFSSVWGKTRRGFCMCVEVTLWLIPLACSLPNCPLVRLRRISLGIVACMAPSARAFSPEEVDAAVDKCVSFLKAGQNKEGNWEAGKRPKGKGEGGPDEAARWGGETAIATYALCAAGEDQSAEVKESH